MKGAGWLSGGGWMSGGAEEYGEGMGPNGGRRSSPQASHMRFIKAYFRKNKNSSKSAVEKMKAANKLWKKSAERRSIAHKIGQTPLQKKKGTKRKRKSTKKAKKSTKKKAKKSTKKGQKIRHGFFGELL